MNPNVDNLTRAANYLVRSTRCTRLVNEMNTFIAHWGTAPKVYAGEMAVLNPLIELGAAAPAKYERLMKTIYEARQASGEMRRADYQKELMRRIRQREQKAIQLAEWMRGRRFLPIERIEFVTQQKRMWEHDRIEYIHTHARDQSMTRAAGQSFWNLIDITLDENLAKAHANHAPPLPAPRKVVVD